MIPIPAHLGRPQRPFFEVLFSAAVADGLGLWELEMEMEGVIEDDLEREGVIEDDLERDDVIELV